MGKTGDTKEEQNVLIIYIEILCELIWKIFLWGSSKLKVVESLDIQVFSEIYIQEQIGLKTRGNTWISVRKRKNLRWWKYYTQYIVYKINSEHNI